VSFSFCSGTATHRNPQHRAISRFTCLTSVALQYDSSDGTDNAWDLNEKNYIDATAGNYHNMWCAPGPISCDCSMSPHLRTRVVLGSKLSADSSAGSCRSLAHILAGPVDSGNARFMHASHFQIDFCDVYRSTAFDIDSSMG